MRILKPGEPCPCCGQPIKEELPRGKMLLLSYIAEGVSLIDAINAISEVMELPPAVEPLREGTPKARKMELPVPEVDEGDEKRAILQRLKNYRAAHGPGCLAAVSARTARRRDRRISDDVLRNICADGAPKLPIEDWRSIGRALDALEQKGD